MQPLQPVSGSDLQTFLSAPEQLLQQSVALQLAIASFHQTPRSLLEILVNSPDTQVAEAASLHVNLAGEITDGWQQADDLVSILAEYASSENAFVRLVTLLHPLTPHEVLTQGAQSASWLERYAVADNSGTPSELR